MRVINLIWGFANGGGVEKCYMVYARLRDVDDSVEIKNVCVNIKSRTSHTAPLETIGAEIIDVERTLDLSWINKLNTIIKSYGPDIVFTHGFNGAGMMLIEKLVKHDKTKVILSYHGEYYAPVAIKKFIAPIYNRMFIWACKHMATKVISVAEVSSQFLIGKGVIPDKVVTVHNGIEDIDVDPLNLGYDGVSIVSASRIDKIKGLDYLLKALSILKEKDIEFKYFMIGDGPELENLKKLAGRLNIVDRVEFVGFQNNVSMWLRAANIFVLTSSFENHSIALIEAMRAQCAIMATIVGGNKESIENGKEGFLVSNANSEEMAHVLEKLITSKVMREDVAKNARKRYEREFTEDIMKRNIVNVLKSCN